MGRDEKGAPINAPSIHINALVDVGSLWPWGIMNQHPPTHHPLDAHYYLVVDEPQLS
jgi:hypothetical protein